MPAETASLELGDNGVNPDRHALTQEVYRLRGLRGRYVQIEIAGSAGRVVVSGVQIRARVNSRGERDKP